MKKFLETYRSLKNFRIALSSLCVLLGIVCYYFLYDANGYLDEIILTLAILFSAFMFVTLIYFVEKPLQKLNDYIEIAATGAGDTNVTISDLQEYKTVSKSFNFLLRIFKESTEHVKQIEQNNLNFKIENSNEHVLKQSLKALQEQMIRISDEAVQREWTNEGLNQFVDILRSSDGNLENLGRTIISQLVKYTKSSHAGLYIYDEGKENLKQIASYAYNRDKYSTDLIPEGFGLLWQCLFEKKPIHLREIPKDYVQITSGLGGARPNSILIIPLLLEEDTYGVMELASFNKYQDFEVDFIQRLAENISSTIAAAETNQQTKILLNESEVKTTELQEQEQQMRQNMEEMQSTQEEMQRIQQEIMHKDYNIKALLDTSTDTFFAIDREYKIIVVNRTLKEKYISNGIDLKEGDNIFDCIPLDQHELWKSRYDRCFSGENYTQEIESKSKDGEILYQRGYYSAIYDNDFNVIGASVRSTDVSEINNYNLEIMELNKTIMNMKDEMQKNDKTVENYLKVENNQMSPKISNAKKELQKLKKRKGKK